MHDKTRTPTSCTFWLALAPILGQAKSVGGLIWLWLLLLGAVFLFCIIVAVARLLYLRSRSKRAAERELLEEFNEALQRGEMSPEEFARVRRLLVSRFAGDSEVHKQVSASLPSKDHQSDLPPAKLEAYAETGAAESANPPKETDQNQDTDSPPSQTSASA